MVFVHEVVCVKEGLYFFFLVFFFFSHFWLHLMACETLVPQPGIKPTPPDLEAPCLNMWTAREVPSLPCKITFY